MWSVRSPPSSQRPRRERPGWRFPMRNATHNLVGVLRGRWVAMSTRSLVAFIALWVVFALLVGFGLNAAHPVNHAAGTPTRPAASSVSGPSTVDRVPAVEQGLKQLASVATAA